MSEIVVGRSVIGGAWVWFETRAEAEKCGASEITAATPEEVECGRAILKADRAKRMPHRKLGEKMWALLAMREK